MKMCEKTASPIAPGRFLLPGPERDLGKWAVIACDQFTSEPEYWRQAEEARAGAPSALDIIYPEAWLAQGDERIARINGKMREYSADVLTRATEGFILVERETSDGVRLGLVVTVDLEQYDPSAASKSPIRPTEGTVAERVPPRVRIREGASLEASHVLLLADDPGDTLIGPLYRERGQMELLYDFDLMLGGGHIRGWLVDGARAEGVQAAMAALREKGGGLDLAVGDGNHSLAAAAACWRTIRAGLSEAERTVHPARWAMAEINNLHADSLRFHPIHRALFGECAGLEADFDSWLRSRGMALEACAPDEADLTIDGKALRIAGREHPLAVGVLQPFLDEWLSKRPDARIDYIHGDEALEALGRAGAKTIALKAMDKADLFPAVRIGPLPRKTFSMGEARDKRYYLETRVIR